jgi:hypothetical protein
VSEAVTAAQTAVQSQIDSKLDVDGKAVDSAHADDADTVNNHTVLSDVPSNAVFTDTTYQQMTDQELEDGVSTQGRVVAAHTIATFILNVIADVINSAPAALDTLEELAAAINDDPDFHVTVMNEIGKKLDKAGGVVTGDLTVNGTITGNVTGNVTGSSGSCTGNAATASKAAQLTTARTIEGVSFNGTANITHYGSCSTAAATVEKTVACTGFTLAAGARIEVKFTVTNTAANPTLNVNSTGAKAIYYRGAAISAGYLAANRTYTFIYNGTQYDLIGDLNTDTNNATAQNISTTNATYPILLGYTADATANIGNKAALFSSKAKLNASTAAMTLNGKTVPVVSSFNSTTGVLALVSSGS